MYVIFSVPPEKRSKVNEILKDDVVSRQSIVVREDSVLGLKDLGMLVLIEGEDSAIGRSKELFKDVGKALEGGQAADVYQRFKNESEDVASSVGFIFG